MQLENFLDTTFIPITPFFIELFIKKTSSADVQVVVGIKTQERSIKEGN